MKYFAVICLVLICGCPKQPDSVRADHGCPMACDKLRTFQCSEGKSPHCIDLCHEIVESGFLDVDFSCLENAKNADQLRVCGVCNP